MEYHPFYSRVVLTLWRPILLGKKVLVGITDSTPDGTIEGYRQFLGQISDVRPKQGVLLKLQNGEFYWLPPDHRPLKKAPKGEYRLRSTGQVVVDPDYLCNWISNKPTDN
jgi:hypothetical protein